MPYLNFKLSGTSSPELSRRVAAALTGLTEELLKKKRELTAVAVEYADPASWFIDGRPLVEHGRRSFYLDIKVTKGTNTKLEKAAYVESVFATLEEIVGPLHPASYIVIQEIEADAWGYQGRTQEFRFISGRPQ